MAFAGTSGGCLSQAPVDFEPAAAAQAMISHLAKVHPASTPRARKPDPRPPALEHPYGDCSRSTTRGSGSDSVCKIPSLRLTTRATACFAKKPTSTANKLIHNTESLGIACLLSQAKTIAALTAAAGILRSTAHSAKQSSGERSQVLAHSKHRSATDHDHRPACLYEAVQARAHTGVRHKSQSVKGIPVSSIHVTGVRREAIGTASIG